MTGFYFTLLAVLLSGISARDQVLVAALSDRQGQRPGVLITAGVVSILTATIAAWLATSIAPLLAPQARSFLAGLSLLFAGGELLIFAPRRSPKEPTRSLAALAIVLTSHQLTDAARFLIFGIAVATNAPIPAAAGGAIGGIVLLGAGWALPQVIADPRLRIARRLIGGGLVLIGAYVCLSAIGKL
ncbi:MAG: hypothetical protein P8J20_07200 [Novosphingobium sp.]|nr:hypothetical protein [Novosphingobium sp.]